ncbi:FecR family protein [Dyadobacter bucti]|uniref:FecR family protein n=1 Tax=Dyadobacter bucti TaxID=2572203 RepID=UPI003F701F0F
MSDNAPWPLIAKYLAGECSPEEKLTIEWWLEEIDNRILFEEIKAAWERQSEPDIAFSAERGLGKLHTKISEAAEDPAEPFERPVKLIKISSWLAAAGILLLIGFSYLFFNQNTGTGKTDRTAYLEKTSGQDEVISFSLPDGSKVWLNENSKIGFPKEFSGEYREVLIEGEAFFEVVPNPRKPFIVRSNKVSTRVLGTSFNVKAYRYQQTASVSVATGKVEVSKEIGADEPIRITQLTPRQELVINTQKDETYIDIVSTYDIGAWRREQLVFRNNTYTEVIVRLEKEFGVKIDLQNKSLSNCRVMASFNEGAVLNDVLKLLSISNSFRYDIKENQVTILGGVCR